MTTYTDIRCNCDCIGTTFPVVSVTFVHNFPKHHKGCDKNYNCDHNLKTLIESISRISSITDFSIRVSFTGIVSSFPSMILDDFGPHSFFQHISNKSTVHFRQFSSPPQTHYQSISNLSFLFISDR